MHGDRRAHVTSEDRLQLQKGPTVKVSITWHNDNPNTIWNRLAARLGRTPTNAEAREEVLRIMREAQHQTAAPK
jgi:hypothetical protein